MWRRIAITGLSIQVPSLQQERVQEIHASKTTWSSIKLKSKIMSGLRGFARWVYLRSKVPRMHSKRSCTIPHEEFWNGKCWIYFSCYDFRNVCVPNAKQNSIVCVERTYVENATSAATNENSVPERENCVRPVDLMLLFQRSQRFRLLKKNCLQVLRLLITGRI
jgi:hypothetical protein